MSGHISQVENTAGAPVIESKIHRTCKVTIEVSYLPF